MLYLTLGMCSIMFRRDFSLSRMSETLSEHIESIYSVQGVLAAYLDAEPNDISISGTLAETGVDETAVITFKYSDGRVGVASCNARAQLHNEGRISNSISYTA